MYTEFVARGSELVDSRKTSGKRKKKTDKRTWVVRIAAIAIALLMLGSVFAVIFSAQM